MRDKLVLYVAIAVFGFWTGYFLNTMIQSNFGPMDCLIAAFFSALTVLSFVSLHLIDDRKLEETEVLD